MQLVHTETLGPYGTDTWGSSGYVAGPGVFVVIVTCPLGDTETLQAQVILSGDAGAIFAVVEDVTGLATDLSSVGAQAGFQSAPVPLLDGSWEVAVRVKHDSATSQSFEVRVIKL